MCLAIFWLINYTTTGDHELLKFFSVNACFLNWFPMVTKFHYGKALEQKKLLAEKKEYFIKLGGPVFYYRTALVVLEIQYRQKRKTRTAFNRITPKRTTTRLGLKCSLSSTALHNVSAYTKISMKITLPGQLLNLRTPVSNCFSKLHLKSQHTKQRI